MAKKKRAVVPLKPLNYDQLKPDADTPLSPTGKDKPPPPSLVIPPTPSPSSGPPSIDHDRGNNAWATPAQTSEAVPSPSPEPLELPSVAGSVKDQPGAMDLNAASIASPEILALANFQISIKQTLAELAGTIDQLQVQSDRMEKLGADIKIHEQIALLRNEVEEQIRRQEADLESVRQALTAKVKAAVQEYIKTKLLALAKESISRTVRAKVHEELTARIPDQVREGLLGNQRQIEEVKASIHNSEARRYNASLQSASLEVPLRPLLRPLPTPEQSPYPVLATTSVPCSRLNSALPLSAYPCPPAPTPIAMRRSTSGLASSISRTHSYQAIAPTPSALFPKDLRSLFALGPDATKALLREYGLESTLPSPAPIPTVVVVDEPASANLGVPPNSRLKAPKMQKRASSSGKTAAIAVPQPSIPEEKESDESEDEEGMKEHVQDMNKFMAHIGVPFLMVPPPKRRETNAERRKKLTPLIINAIPGSIR